MIPPPVEAAIKSMINVARLAARPALDNVFRELAFTKIALVVLRELPACLTNPLVALHDALEAAAVDPRDDRDLARIRHLREHRDSTGLRDRLNRQNARHHRPLREMAGE